MQEKCSHLFIAVYLVLADNAVQTVFLSSERVDSLLKLGVLLLQVPNSCLNRRQQPRLVTYTFLLLSQSGMRNRLLDTTLTEF